MVPGERRELPPRRRAELLTTAAAEFARAGYEAASLNRILRACTMSKSSFYHYVPAKSALFDMVIAAGAEELVRLLAPPAPQELADGDFWAAVGDLLARLAALGSAPSFLTDVGRLFHLEDAPRLPGSALVRAEAAIDGWLRAVVGVGRARGAVRTDLPESLQAELALAVLRTLDAWSLRHAAELADAPAVVGAQLDVVRRLLARP